MSRTFYIKNSQVPKVMTPQELLELQNESFVQYDTHQEDENFEKIMFSPINDYGYMLMGQDGISGRGFEVSYSVENEEYEVRVFTPSTEADWLGAFEFIKNVANYLGVQVTDEEEFEYEADKISYDYRRDIEFGIKCYEGKEGQFLFGVNRPICVDAEIVKKMLSADDKVAFFSKFVEEQQYVDAYIAKQMFYQDKKSGDIFGVYSITESVSTILPYEYPPFIDITKISLNQEQVKEWRISLVIIDGDEDISDSYKVIGDIDYQTFLKRLPEEKKQKLDGHYMLVKISSQKEMEALLYENAPQKEIGILGKIKGWFSSN